MWHTLVIDGYGDGDGDGNGYGYGHGSGNGYGLGSGNGYGRKKGNGNGDGNETIDPECLITYLAWVPLATKVFNRVTCHTQQRRSKMQEIVVVQGGWVFVGTLSIVGDLLVLNDAKNIRVWGTKNGLGELAIRGKTKDTVLDDYGVVKVPLNAVLARIECKVVL